MSIEEIKKPHTSSAVKNRYNAKVYDTVKALLPKEMVKVFKEKLKAKGMTQAQIIKEAVEKFLAE